MPPINDNFADAMVLTGISGLAPPLDNIGATTEPGEPSASDGRNYNSMWYKWTAPVSGTQRFATTGSTRTSDGGGLDTTLAIWTGTSLGSLVEVTSNDEDPDSYNTSVVNFTAVAGTTYYIQVANWNPGVVGTVLLSWGAPVYPAFSHIQFGDNLSITDLGGGRIRVDGKDVPYIPLDYSPTPMKIAYFKTAAPITMNYSGGIGLGPYWEAHVDNWFTPPDVTPASGNLSLVHPEIYGSGGTLDTTKWMIHTEDPVSTLYEVCLYSQFSFIPGDNPPTNMIPATWPGESKRLPRFGISPLNKYGEGIYNGLTSVSFIEMPIRNYDLHPGSAIGDFVGLSGRYLVQMMRNYEPYTSDRPPGAPLYGRGMFNFGISFYMWETPPSSINIYCNIVRASPPPWWSKNTPISFYE